MSTAIVWFRRDLRLIDQPALFYASKHYDQIIALYIHSDDAEYPIGGASRWWLHHSLSALNESLEAKQSRLIIRRGSCLEVLEKIIKESGADAVFWNRLYEPDIIACDSRIKETLTQKGLIVKSFNASLLNEPWAVTKSDGQPYKVFTAYMNACIKQFPFAHKPLPTPKTLPNTPDHIKSDSVKKLALLSNMGWDKTFYSCWQPGEVGAHHALNRFAKEQVNDYSEARNFPSTKGTSLLSPHLAFGEISAHTIHTALSQDSKKRVNASAYIRQLYWRDFANYLLFHFPHTINSPMDKRFIKFPWRKNTKKELAAWQRGQTGIPIIDAGMRELWSTGWMHNRVRMIVASFLCKNCLITWQQGAQWFWDTLVDADLANNTMGWQWVAGCGADAAPYFRIFNPILQSEKFDRDGAYIKKWVPELTSMPSKYIHAPWQAPSPVLTDSGIRLGKTYPLPLVDLSQSRTDALTAFSQIKNS